jgi:hypothetical protein
VIQHLQHRGPLSFWQTFSTDRRTSNNGYYDEKSSLSHISDEGGTYYSDVDETYEEYIQERTEAMDEYVHLHDTGWYEE